MRAIFSAAVSCGGSFVLLVLNFSQPFSAYCQGSTFTYQGQLQVAGAPANGSHDFTFALYATPTGGSVLSGPVTNAAVGVTNGLFTSLVNLGDSLPAADAWLQLAVRTNGVGNFVPLSPRQQVTPVPYALLAQNISGVIAPTQLPPGVVTNGGNFSGSFHGSGLGLTNVTAVNLLLGATNIAPSNTWQVAVFSNGVPMLVDLANLMRASNSIWTVGDNFEIRSVRGGSIGFLDYVHSAYPLIYLGNLKSDVVIAPSPFGGLLQIGQTGNPGSWIYLQYAAWPFITNQLTFSHPLEFRSRAYNGGAATMKRPGIQGVPAANDGSEHGVLKFFSVAPHWNSGNLDGENPNVPGALAASIGTNGVVAAPGVRFVGDGSGLTNLPTSGGAGLTTNVLVGEVLMSFTGGLLTGVGFDGDALNWLSRTSTTNPTHKLAINQLVVDLKAANCWTNLAVLYVPLSHLAAFNGENLKGDTFDMIWNNGVAHTNSVGFDGINDYGDTGFNPTLHGYWSQNSAFMAIYCGSLSLPDGASLGGVDSGSTQRGTLSRSGAFARLSGFNNNFGYALASAAGDFSGLWIGNRVGAAQNENSVWLRGGQGMDGSGGATTGIVNGRLFVGARNGFGNADNFCAFNLRLFAAGAGLDATKLVAFQAAVGRLKNSLGWP